MKIAYGLSLIIIVLISIFISRKDTENVIIKAEPIAIISKNLPILQASFEEVQNNRGPLRFNSFGGDVPTSYALSRYLRAQEWEIVIDFVCASGCAEFIIPSAGSVVFENEPLIGFHGNANSYEYFKSRLDEQGAQTCKRTYHDEATALLVEAGLNPDFWKETMAVLKPDVDPQSLLNSCGKIDYNFENDIWLPTSQQLREKYGLQFKGKVCADNFRKCSKKIDGIFQKGFRAVIGDRIHISKGILDPQNHWHQRPN